MLAAHFDALIDAESKKAENAEKLEVARGQIRALRARLAKLEKASAVRRVARVKAPAAKSRPAVDTFVAEIERTRSEHARVDEEWKVRTTT